MSELSSFYLLVGLGNPGNAYSKTRHNMGFRVVQALAEKNGWSFRKEKSSFSELAEGKKGDKTLLLLLPQTYMNSSGEAVRIAKEYYKLPMNNMMVVLDDIYLPFGSMRLKTSGSSGGHNGLKSIETHLGSQVYARLKIGVGDREGGDLADHVLSPFSKEEEEKVPSLIQKAVEGLEIWLSAGITKAMQHLNGP